MKKPPTFTETMIARFTKSPQAEHQFSERLCRSYLEHRALARVAPALGCTPHQLGRLLELRPALRVALDRTMADLRRRELERFRQKELTPSTAPPPPAWLRRWKRRGTPCLSLDLEGGAAHVPDSQGEEPSGNSRGRKSKAGRGGTSASRARK